jgi:hypothetical protein
VESICPEAGMRCSYRVDVVYQHSSSEPLSYSSQTISKLLRQATFGPSLLEINAFLKEYGDPASPAVVASWVGDQVALPATLTRGSRVVLYVLCCVLCAVLCTYEYL